MKHKTAYMISLGLRYMKINWLLRRATVRFVCGTQHLMYAFKPYSYWHVFMKSKDLPIRAWQEHTREVFSVDWSNIQKDTFASSSWDGTVKIVSHLDFKSLYTYHPSVDTRTSAICRDITGTSCLCLSGVVLATSPRLGFIMLDRRDSEDL